MTEEKHQSLMKLADQLRAAAKAIEDFIESDYFQHDCNHEWVYSLYIYGSSQYRICRKCGKEEVMSEWWNGTAYYDNTTSTLEETEFDKVRKKFGREPLNCGWSRYFISGL